jgi:predicted amidohydrolase YtcJ
MKKMLLAGLLFTVISGFSDIGAEEGLMADMVVFNGRIFTVDAAQPWAQAVAIRDGKFVAVGKDEEIKRLVGKDTEVIDLQGKLALPGYI